MGKYRITEKKKKEGWHLAWKGWGIGTWKSGKKRKLRLYRYVLVVRCYG